MRYRTVPAYDRSLRPLPEIRKKRVKKAVRLAVSFFETGEFSRGLGLKPLSQGIWEIRAGLEDRIIFRKNDDLIEFLLVGSHDEIRRVLKEL